MQRQSSILMVYTAMKKEENSGVNSSLNTTISVIMPVFNASHFLPQVMPPLLEMQEKGEILEILVVDDCSTDSSASVAAGLGARVVPSPHRSGPGAARNIGASRARGELLWFVDADVVAHPNGAAAIRAAFKDSEVVAVFGSYDHAPPARNFASQYKNLVHHYYHQKARREASTFWAGCGAVRKSRFLGIGGFDVARYTRPSIEDIELGYRLREKGGRILLLRELQGKHLKRWTIRDVVFTDVIRRAVPWARLMLTEVGLTDDLNVSKAERFRAVVAGLFFLGVLGALLEPTIWYLPAAMLASVIGVNWDFFTFLRRRKGVGFAISGLAFHQVYYLYSSAAFAWCWVEALGRRPAGPVTRSDPDGGAK